jgi:hypothetical protein
LELPLDLSHYTLGLILPDLLRNANKNTRLPKTLPSNILYQKSGLLALDYGAKVHQATDGVFHGAAFFEQATHQIKAILSAQTFAAIDRPSFLAHIMFELALDRQLMFLNPNLAAEFYDNLSQTKDKTICKYLADNNIQENHIQNFLLFLREFNKHKYLHSYTDNSQIAFALCRIYQRATQKNVMTDRDRVAHVITEVDAYLAPLVPEILEHTITVLRQNMSQDKI